MTNPPDITYTKGPIFTSFYPETDEGQKAYAQICETLGSATVLNLHLKSTLQQLRKAGYIVRVAKAVQMSDGDILEGLGI